LKAFIAIHPLDPEDVPAISSIRTAASAAKGVRWTVEARRRFDALMESVPPPLGDVAFESGTVGEIPGLWVYPASSRSSEAVLHLHGGGFNAGSPRACRHLVGHIAARTRTTAFVPEYRLAREHPFPAAVDDMLAAYRGMIASGTRCQLGACPRKAARS
jgi:acetyl esterase/lipase